MPLNVPLVDTFAPSRDAFGQLQNALASGPAFQMSKLKLGAAQDERAELRELQQLMAQTPQEKRPEVAIQYLESKGHVEEAAKLRHVRQQLFDQLYERDPQAATRQFPELGVDANASNLKVGEKIAGTRNIPYQMGGKRGFMQAEQTPEEMQKEAEFKARGSMQGGIKTPEQLQSDVAQAGAIETAKQAARPIKPDQSISNTELFMKDPAAFERMKDTEARVSNKYVKPHAPGSEATVTIQTMDEQGNPVTKVMTKKDALEASKGGGIARPTTAATQTKIDAAKKSLDVGNGLVQYIQTPAVSSKIGPIMGRYQNFHQFIGDPSPEVAKLRGKIASFAALQPAIHGMRNYNMMEHIENLMGTQMTPEAMTSAIDGILDASRAFANYAPSGGSSRKPPITAEEAAAELARRRAKK